MKKHVLHDLNALLGSPEVFMVEDLALFAYVAHYPHTRAIDMPAQDFFAFVAGPSTGKSKNRKMLESRLTHFLERNQILATLPMRRFILLPVRELTSKIGVDKKVYNLMKKLASQGGLKMKPYIRFNGWSPRDKGDKAMTM